jgi:uncharacterized protein YbbC (DUF1343 family)
MLKHFLCLCLFSTFLFGTAAAKPSAEVANGSDMLWQDSCLETFKGKRLGVITNHTAVNRHMQTTADLLKSKAAAYNYTVSAFFAPEHGINGSAYAAENIAEQKDNDAIPIFSLHGKTQRPTAEMLKTIDILIYDIQDIGSRTYTYTTTLFYAMEEAAKYNIPVIVLDRPNPLGGFIVDGPMLEEKWRSMLGYINVPYCHGMTVGELARFFNSEYRVGCQLHIVPMKGWRRHMTFQETGLPWVPTSPNIPEATTAFYYPTTGILGELQLVNIGIGYTLPFKVVGTPWIEANRFAEALNSQKFPGVYFQPFYYRPFYGRFAQENCQGVLIIVTDPPKYKPVSTQYLLIGMLKSLYPEKFQDAITAAKARRKTLCKVNGTEEVVRLITEENNIVWKLRALHQKERDLFLKKRKKYLIAAYSDE